MIEDEHTEESLGSSTQMLLLLFANGVYYYTIYNILYYVCNYKKCSTIGAHAYIYIYNYIFSQELYSNCKTVRGQLDSYMYEFPWLLSISTTWVVCTAALSLNLRSFLFFVFFFFCVCFIIVVV